MKNRISSIIIGVLTLFGLGLIVFAIKYPQQLGIIADWIKSLF